MNKTDEKDFKIFLSKVNENMNENFGETNQELFWMIPPLIFSKKLFKNGKSLNQFISEVFEIEFRPYVYKSRTILLGRLLKRINGLSPEECVKVSNELVNFSKKLIEGNDKHVKKGDSSNFFSDWSNYLNSNK
jgi:hypothetical protein